jgi:hypothetical protein
VLPLSILLTNQPPEKSTLPGHGKIFMCHFHRLDKGKANGPPAQGLTLKVLKKKISFSF